MCCQPVLANALQGVLWKHLARFHAVGFTSLLFNLDLDYSACLELAAAPPIAITAGDFTVQQGKHPALHYQLLFYGIHIQPSVMQSGCNLLSVLSDDQDLLLSTRIRNSVYRST